MEFKTYTVLTLMVVSNAALAWQPLTYPVQSQSPYQRSIDTATCFAHANKTKIDIKREPQIPPRPQPASKATSTGVPSRPPLPPSTFSAAPMSASMPSAATGASEPVTTAATAAGASAPHPASAPGAGTSNAATTANPQAAATDMGASGTAAGSSEQANAASGVKLPPLPAPEPPMTQYWAAYGACMQARGYVVAQ
jgi:hypothetical protein